MAMKTMMSSWETCLAPAAASSARLGTSALGTWESGKQGGETESRVGGSKSRGERKKENRRHKEKLEKKGDKVQLLQLSVWINVDCLSRWQNYNAEKWYSQLCLSFFLRNRKSINAITRGFVLGKFTKRHCRSVCKCNYSVCRFEKSPITISILQLVFVLHWLQVCFKLFKQSWVRLDRL